MAIKKKAAAKVIFSLLIIMDGIAFFETVIHKARGMRYIIRYVRMLTIMI